MQLPFRKLDIIAALAAAGLLSATGDNTATAQLVPPVDDVVPGIMDDPLLDETRRRLDRRLERPLEKTKETVDEAAGAVTEPVEQAAEGAVETADRTVDAAAEALQPVANAVRGVLRPFNEGVDPFGHAIEEDVLMVLVEPGALTELEQSGWPVTGTRRFRSLGLVLARIEGPARPSLAQAAGELRAEFPGAAVDYNFLYRFADRASVAADDEPATDDGGYMPAGTGVRVGLIDSAVEANHPALAGVRIVASDFAPHEGARPLGHGTAVASILAEEAGVDTEILAASVFFQKPGFAPGATSESLVAALDWLAGSEVDAINMSLAGPADDLLERALERIAAGGPTVVAAVGNNGPSGKPLYPAAYSSVIGVTAIDRDQRIFAYANRGDYVAFAALGVNVKVANTGGGWRLESGTSMASPRVAAVIAGALHASGLQKDALIESLRASAVDLGDEGFDPVFGYGLVQPPRDQNAAASLTE